LHGSRVRIWIENESGLSWPNSRTATSGSLTRILLLGGERAYDAETMETYVFTVPTQSGPRVFTERLLSLRNDTSERLKVELRYLAADAGAPQWRSLKQFLLEPGQLLAPRQEDGQRVRASQVQVRATGDNLYFGADSTNPRSLIEEFNGIRAYRGDKIGSYVYSFTTRPVSQRPTK